MDDIDDQTAPIEKKTRKSRKPRRPERVPMGAGLKLDYRHKKEGFHYRWVQDRDGRLEMAVAAYYDFVMEDGDKVTRASGPFTLYLMCIEERYYQEDQELKLKRTTDTLKKEQELGQGEYIPNGNHHALQKDDYDPLA
jgi:hypothetical protein